MALIPQWVSILYLIGSSLTAMGGLCIIISFLIFPEFRSFRHQLILSLAISDFTNGFTGSISGGHVANRIPLSKGFWCTVNGYTEQFSVQATDLNILFIAIATYLSVAQPIKWKNNDTWMQRYRYLVFAFIWLFSNSTALIALLTVGYAPVTGNWCWLPPDPEYLRYVLTHAWRFIVIVAIITLYILITIKLKRMAKQVHLVQHDMKNSSDHEKHNSSQTSSSQANLYSKSRSYKRLQAAMRKLYYYPIAFTLLWMPGILTRLSEAFGPTITVFVYMQASTQYVGFTNFILYGWSENLASAIVNRFFKQKPKHRYTDASI